MGNKMKEKKLDGQRNWRNQYLRRTLSQCLEACHRVAWWGFPRSDTNGIVKGQQCDSI